MLNLKRGQILTKGDFPENFEQKCMAQLDKALEPQERAICSRELGLYYGTVKRDFDLAVIWLDKAITSTEDVSFKADILRLKAQMTFDRKWTEMYDQLAETKVQIETLKILGQSGQLYELVEDADGMALNLCEQVNVLFRMALFHLIVTGRAIDSKIIKDCNDALESIAQFPLEVLSDEVKNSLSGITSTMKSFIQFANSLHKIES